jgi:hypothetical protein
MISMGAIRSCVISVRTENAPPEHSATYHLYTALRDGPRSRFTSAWNSPAADRLTPPRNAGTSIGATEDLRNLPLHLRKNNLARLLARRPQGIFVSEFEQGDIGPDLFRKACEFGLKGMVSKRRDSAYRAGRSSNGIKVKNPASPAMKRAKDAVFMTTVRHQTRCVDRRFEERV